MSCVWLPPSGLPRVRFLCGAVEVIKRERWTFKAAGGLYLSRQQLPLKLAWAISIHKSQVSDLTPKQATDSYLIHCYIISFVLPPDFCK